MRSRTLYHFLPLPALVSACDLPTRPHIGADATTSVATGGTSKSVPVPSAPSPPGRAPRRCPEDMIHVQGEYCPNLEQRCESWISRSQGRCGSFAEPSICRSPASRIEGRDFCVDRYEFPNQAGVRPAVMVNWYEAKAACSALGKRLCRDSEWTVACEGRERRPYPYGFERDAKACNIDRKYRNPDFTAFAVDRRVSGEVSRLDQRVLSGSMPGCRSPAGVQDMTGNVDEWVVNESGEPHSSGLKGGYFGPIRARCRPMTTFHNEAFRFYQIGFRCCRDPAPG